jgi:hypothetical protein
MTLPQARSVAIAELPSKSRNSLSRDQVLARMRACEALVLWGGIIDTPWVKSYVQCRIIFRPLSEDT